MFSILILQDDLTQSGTIKKIIEDKYPQWKVYIARSYTEAKDLMEQYDFGLFLVDIELSKDQYGYDGIDFGKAIRDMPDYKNIPLLFLTVVTDKVLQSLQEIHHGSYIVKPYLPELLIETIAYLARMENNNKELFLKDSNGVYQKVNPKDINYLEANGKNIAIHTDTYVVIIANYSVTKILQMLPVYFIRCHRKYIINKKKLISYDKSTRIINLGHCNIPVGRKYKEALEKILKLWYIFMVILEIF